MKARILFLLTLTLLAVTNRLPAQGTAFTYQGQLQNNGSPASGTYNLTFSLFNVNSGGTVVAGPVTTNNVIVTNGLFTVLIDFGPGVFTGTNYWLEVGVETNGAGSFSTLTPRQPLTPAPYAIHAESVTASGISGTLTNGQLTHSAVTVDAGPGLSGGGKVTLGNTITLTNTGVLSVTGNADITAMTVGSAVTLGDTATSADTASTLVKRDSSGDFSAATITLDGNLNLPATTATAGIINSGATTLIHAYGSQNFFAGPGAGNLTMTGAFNTANGYESIYSNADGANNTANGAYALYSNTSGSYNTANGAGALEYNTNGNGNTASGFVALQSNTSGSANTADGSGAMLNNTTGSYNTANGDNALYANTNGTANTANGYESLYSNTGDNVGGGSYNTASGYQALYANTVGYDNTAYGAYALYSNTGDDSGNGAYNTASGYGALYFNTSGYENTASGYQALLNNTNGYDNTAYGASALFYNANGANNTAVGFDALENRVGGGNTAVGSSAFEAIGDIGKAMNNNTAIGAKTLAYLYSGDNNTALGWSALGNMVGSGNTAVGMNAFGANSEVVGNAMNNNTAIGINSLDNLLEGNANIALGNGAGHNLNYGTNNIEIGNAGAALDNNVIKIGTEGTQTNTFIAGIHGQTVSGSAVMVSSSGQLGVAPSSQRFKQDIHSMDAASRVLLSLRPVTFKYKPGIDPKGTPQFGLVAEEVAKVDPDLVVRDGKDQIFTVRYEAVNAMLLNEFLKEHRTVEEQKAEIQTLNQRLDRLEQLIAQKTGGQP